MPDARPRLRPLELFPVDVDGQSLICLRDPSGLTDRVGLLPRPAALAAVLCDGSRSVAEVAAELGRRTGAEVSAAQIAQLLEQLDDGLFLEGPRLERHRGQVLAAFRAAPARAASHAGGAYAGEPDDLRAAIADWTEQIAAEPAPRLLAAEPGAPAVLVSPHIDYHRGGLTYARAWRAVAAAARPDLVVVLGTDHNGTDWPFTLTRKRYETPLGALPTDVALVDELCGRLPAHAEGLFADELHHRSEHSIELQAVWLAERFGADAPPMLPVLCGSLHAAIGRRASPAADPRVAEFLGALRAATAGRRVLVVAGADLAHVGPRFGDGPMRAPDRQRIEQDDRRALAATAARDAEGFFAAIAALDDRNRVCGLAPIYHALALAGRDGRRGEVIDYDQCKADDAGTSFVSIAALAI
jgi:hypothetical protein